MEAASEEINSFLAIDCVFIVLQCTVLKGTITRFLKEYWISGSKRGEEDAETSDHITWSSSIKQHENKNAGATDNLKKTLVGKELNYDRLFFVFFCWTIPLMSLTWSWLWWAAESIDESDSLIQSDRYELNEWVFCFAHRESFPQCSCDLSLSWHTADMMSSPVMH